MRVRKPWPWGLAITALASSLLLTGCELDGSNSSTPPTREEAWRFLSQATFGPDEQSILDVTTQGYSTWIDNQFNKTARIGFRAFMRQRDAELKADQPGVSGVKAGPNQVLEAFYVRALQDPAQLRARLVFALSEIFVVSFANEVLGGVAPEMVATYLDTLDSALDGNFRGLLEKVTLSPAMGEYLTFRGNSKEDASVGRLPDENYAREVMQLFTIGLYQLNADGTRKLDGSGQPIPTYASADVKGLAKVFTGWGMYRGSGYSSQSESDCFSWALTCRDPAGYDQAMVPYPAYHSTSVKTFLGTTIASQGTPSPQASLQTALDTLANHPNVAPFISKQLIQRLVSSNPSAASNAHTRAMRWFVESGDGMAAPYWIVTPPVSG